MNVTVRTPVLPDHEADPLGIVTAYAERDVAQADEAFWLGRKRDLLELLAEAEASIEESRIKQFWTNRANELRKQVAECSRQIGAAWAEYDRASAMIAANNGEWKF